MTEQARAFKKVVILGGGTAGWMAAIELAHLIPKIVDEVVLIESPDIATIGVGEATIPPFVSFLRALNIDEVDFIKNTQATFKLGIQFRDWCTLGENYFHPFGAIGPKMKDGEFCQYWLKAYQKGEAQDLYEYSPSVAMARNNRFFLPFKAGRTSPVALSDFALHLDAGLAAKYFRDAAQALGVKRVEANVTEVTLSANGDIDCLTLDRGESIGADFFIDCSGFKALLIGDALGVEYDDWSEHLLCNRAVAMQTKNAGDLKPYTISHAREAGWSWHIPLQHRTGNGYVYCSDYLSDDEAIAALKNLVNGEPLTEPRIIPFRTGKRVRVWQGNCLALGLAAGFLEPLESTAIHLVNQGMQMFLDMRPDQGLSAEKQRKYNEAIDYSYQEIRDFLVLHYCATQRDDTAFWRRVKQMSIPPSLKQRVELFRETGKLEQNPQHLFSKNSWWSVFYGMSLLPAGYPAAVDAIDYSSLTNMMTQYSSLVNAAVQDLPRHEEFIKSFCAAPCDSVVV